MKVINGLSYEQNKRYRTAINAGYFDGYDDDPREWRHSFVGKFIADWPDRTATLNRLTNAIGHVPTWEDFTDDAIDDFILECKEANLLSSSIKTICAELKGTLRKNRRKVPSESFSEKLTLSGEKSQAIYLTREEIQRIANYQVVGKLEQFVRRNFIVECLTGARLRDAMQMTIDNCDIETGTLSYIPDKTSGIVVTVPVDENMNLRRFLADGYYRECCTDVFNETIRKICKGCFIDTPKTIRRREKVVTAPKYELVSSHTARRSFATNLYLAGISIEDIAVLMGHGKNIETTKRYICAERPMSSNVMAYFQPQETNQ